MLERKQSDDAPTKSKRTTSMFNSRSYTNLLTISTPIKNRKRIRNLAVVVAVVFVCFGFFSINQGSEDENVQRNQMMIMNAVNHPAPSQLFAKQDVSDVTIGIYNFMSPSCIVRAIGAIRKFYPHVWIIVLEDSKHPLWGEAQTIDPIGIKQRPPAMSPDNEIDHDAYVAPVHVWTENRVRWYRNPIGIFDVGNGAGRNRIVELTHTKYYFQHDDDWRFSNASDLALLRNFLNTSGYDVVGGCYESTDVGFFATLDKDSQPGTILQHGFQHYGVVQPGIVRSDVVDHTMLARTERLMLTPWSERHRADGEHFLLFIYLWIENAKIASTNQFRLIHGRECRTRRYDRHRFRFSEQWWLRGSVTLDDLHLLGFDDKKDSYLKVDRDAAARLLGGSRLQKKLSYGAHAHRE
eukprot:m.85946 g.85946  ORF g.85946 m.85946 type:complete len:408 (+) comp25911_c0_seq1:162-1385(+)